MPDPEPKPEPKPEPVPVSFDWAKILGPVLITAGLIFVGLRGIPTPTPGPTPPPVPPKPVPVVVQPVDSILELNGVRLDADKTKLFCDVVNAGDGSFILTYQPVGKAKVVRKVVVSGDKPVPLPTPKPDDPVNPDLPPAPVDPDTKVTSAVYVFEKDQGCVPAAVMSGMNRLNREKKIVATVYEQDSKDGTGDTPDQYKVPLEEAKKAGLPALVLMADKTFLKVVKAPKTEAEVVEAIK